MRFIGTTTVALTVGFAAAATGQITPTFDDVPVAVVPTDAGGTLTLRMDVYKPPGVAGPTPVVVWIHGGGWQGGSYNAGLPAVTQPLLQRGIAVATIGYRLSGQAIFPAQIHDVKGAVRFLRANAGTLGINPDRVGAWGSSAGGHLTALLATSGGVAAAEGTTGGNAGFSSRVMAGVDYFGPTDLLQMNPDVTTPPGSTINHDAPTSPESRLIGFDDPGQGIGVLRANQANPAAPYPQLMALVTLVNPVAHVGFDDPAMYVAHGTNDTTVPLFQSTRLANALATAAVPYTYTQVAGAGHGALGTATDAAARDFLSRYLLARDGDADLDQDVDLADFAALGARFNQPDAWRHGDFNNDGAVNIADFSKLAANFNAARGDAAAAATVPEPSVPAAAAVVIFAAAGAAPRSRGPRASTRPVRPRAWRRR